VIAAEGYLLVRRRRKAPRQHDGERQMMHPDVAKKDGNPRSEFEGDNRRSGGLETAELEANEEKDKENVGDMVERAELNA
jgi:hypothetical protein